MSNQKKEKDIDDYAGCIGFMVALVQHSILDCRILTHPLSTLLGGIIPAAIYGFCAAFVSSLLPKKLKFIIPMMLVISTLYLAFITVSGGGTFNYEECADIDHTPYKFYFCDKIELDNVNEFNYDNCGLSIIFNKKFIGFCRN